MKKNLLILSLFAFSACAKAPPPKTPPVSVAATKAMTCDVPLYYDYVGHVTAFNTVQVVPQVQGYLTRLLFIQGQEVQEGDLLATIDVRPYQATLSKAEATLAQNVAALKYSKDAVERYSKLVQNDFVSQLDFDNYVTSVLSNEAIIKQNLADIESAKLNLGYCYLRAPMNSVAGIQLIDVGNFIPAGSSNAIVTLNQIQPIYVYFYIPEEDLVRIRPLQAKTPLKTRAFLEGEKDSSHDGELNLINNQVDEATGSILLEATFANEDKALWPGQFVSVRLFLEECKGAIVIPVQAVQLGQDGAYVYVIKEDMTTEMRKVKKGETTGELVIISSGLNAGETVVVQGQVNITPTSKVKINNQEMTEPTFDNGLTAP